MRNRKEGGEGTFWGGGVGEDNVVGGGRGLFFLWGKGQFCLGVQR